MTVDIDTLLALPKSERRKRWQNIQSGKSVLYSGDELKNMVVEHRKKK